MARLRNSRGSELVQGAPPDHYGELGAPPLGTVEAIRARYMVLAKEHHPDKGGDVARMAAITEAWSVLGDSKRRERYDATLRLMGRWPALCATCGGAGERAVGLKGKRAPCKTCGGTGRKV